MGFNFGSSKSKAVQGDVKVWGPQQPYLKRGFGEAQNIYDNAKGTSWYGGDLYAKMNGGGQDVLGRARQLMQGADPAIAQMFAGGSDNLGRSGGLMGQLVDNLRKGPRGALDYGNELANSEYATGAIDAANRDELRNFNEETLPALNLNASATGNMNSSRVGAREGILARGLADRMADTASSIRGNFFDRGVSQFNDSIDRLGRNAFGLAEDGRSLIGAALGAGQQALGGVQNALGFEQGDRQGQLDADFQKWFGQDSRAMDLLNRFWSVVGGNVGQSPGMGSNSSSSSFGLTSGK